ncbi:MAG: DUF3990 domain-containing protein [Pseudobutyrivibrio sp.]|nr:DUF3990 domain-containing protein [Pseudobutyrivibrio sp.]
MSKLVLYHGSDKIISTPRFGDGKPFNDYGRGFYCTKHIELAKEWAVEAGRDGFVNVYEIEDRGLQILNLNDEKYSILHWITILLEHRSFSVNSPLAMDGFGFLQRNYHIEIDDYDAIIGYRADDSYFSFARAFLANTISIEQLEAAMQLGELGQQFFIKSEKAFSKLKFIGANQVDCAEYYPKKSARDSKARESYNTIADAMDKKGTYLIDLVRKEK